MIIKNVYTQEQVQAIENYWIAKVEHEKEHKERALQRVTTLSGEVHKLNFFVETLSQLLILLVKKG